MSKKSFLTLFISHFSFFPPKLSFSISHLSFSPTLSFSPPFRWRRWFRDGRRAPLMYKSKGAS
ncbi:hypothetical protein ZOSMA_147G00070 [Zostera marina]|uniref:Uncharacterized protein n=1 Tax=Zostera marina TaxID=29655 RepID=A0A0K9PZ30_ZOSMR|nr:hypothetical protein ZOSMA_147G00070 [Zostera marina]